MKFGNLTEKFSSNSWSTPLPPQQGGCQKAFDAVMLLPGLSTAFLAASLGRSRSSIASYRRRALHAVRYDPSLSEAVSSLMRSLEPADGLAMAQQRGNAQLPYWSRLAIAEFCKQGYPRSEIAHAFNCTTRTVSNVLRDRQLHVPDRPLSAAQLNPPAKKAARK